MRRCRLSVLFAAFLAVPGAVLAGSPKAAEQPKGRAGPATKPASPRAEQLAECIRLVREAKEPQQAIEAYARGCALRPTDARVREVYMRRMLRFGLPQIAVYAAQVLVQLQPDNHLAWAVIGHRHGKRKEWAQAFEATAVALEGLASDPSVLYNMGQLVAWQEAQTPLPKLSDRARRVVAQKKAHLEAAAQYVKGYRAIRAFYDTQAKIAREFDAKIEEAEAQATAVLEQGRAIDAAIRSLNDRTKIHEREIRRLKRQLDDTYFRPSYVDAHGRIIHDLEDSILVRQYRRTLRDRILDERRAIDELAAGIASLRRKAQPVLRELARLRGEVQKLKKDKQQAASGVERAFRWDPPAVDGVVTPEAKQPFALEIKKPPAKAVGPQEQAARQLRLAKLYLASQMDDKAAAILQALIAKYPKTPAAQEARALLEPIAPGPGAPQPK